uniref:SZT2 n=1 Tax=Plectus sambesii TaxID=2011161 RepID=A0A914X515_9BILA
MSEEDAAEVFLLMRRDFRVSRNVRALWYFDHLNRTVQVDNFDTPSVQTGEHESSPEHSHKDIEVVGVVPRRSIGEEDSLPHPNENTTYRIRPDTAVTYLSKLYRLVFVLDLSPSTIVADETSGTVLYTKLLGCLTHCLQGVTRTFNIPGSSRVFSPKLYVTICVNSPFLCSVDDFVLLQGCLLEESNVPLVVEEIERKLTQFVDQLAKNLQPHIHRWNRERRRTRDEKAEDLLTGNLFNHSHFADSIDENHRRHSCSSSTTAFKHGASEPVDPAATLADLGFVRPEWSLISMLRLGLLGAQMLPENTPANMIIISDGVCGMPDAHAMQALLTQLRSFTISCSFIQIQPKIVAHTAFGHVGYPQLYHFLSTATFGSFLPDCPCSVPSNEATSEGMLNPFHRAFLCWSFLRGIGGENVHLRRAITAINSYFGDNLNSDCVRRRHLSMVYDTCLNNLLYVRLREGYTVKRVWFTRKSGTSNENQHICVELRLPWKPLVSIEYHINADWPPAANDSKAKVRVEVLIEGPYDFLKDVLSDHKGSFQSTYRRDALQAFDYTLNTLVQADKLLLHLHSFSTRTTYYLPPTSVRDGMPLFYMPPAADKPVISSKDLEHQSPEFCEFWRPVCTLDMSIWQKWLHTHSIRLLLTHDVPLSSHLHSVSSQTNRFGQVQCRQAAAVLHDALKDWASFTMMDNHSYIKFVYGDDSSQPPAYFYIIRTCLDPPCLALKIAFLGGIRGAVRNRVVNELRAKLRSLTIRQRSSTITESELRRVVKPTSLRVANTIEVPALVCLKKPVERVLIRYNRVPLVLNRIVRLETVSDQAAVRQIILHNSLTKYLSCRRWIWQLKRPLPASFPVSNEAAAFILHTLVRRRLQQNFRFAAGANGIINVARELMMTNGRECLVQFVIFPPIPATGHHASTRRTRRELISGSTEASESESTEADSEAQLITELWVEPQMGEIADEDEWLNECHVYSCLHRTVRQSLPFEDYCKCG